MVRNRCNSGTLTPLSIDINPILMYVYVRTDVSMYIHYVQKSLNYNV